MKDEIKKFLFDIKVAVDSIFEYLGDKRNFFVNSANKMQRRAVERKFEKIGKSRGNVSKIDPVFPILNARRIVDLRNFFIHGYDKVDDVIIWGIISRDLPELQNEINELVYCFEK